MRGRRRIVVYFSCVPLLVYGEGARGPVRLENTWASEYLCFGFSSGRYFCTRKYGYAAVRFQRSSLFVCRYVNFPDTCMLLHDSCVSPETRLCPPMVTECGCPYGNTLRRHLDKFAAS